MLYFLLLLFPSLLLNVFPNTPCFSNVRLVVREEDLCFEITHASSPDCSLNGMETANAKLRVMPYNESISAYVIDLGTIFINTTKFCHPGRYYDVLEARLLFSLHGEEWLVIRKKSLKILKTVLKEGTGQLVDDTMSGKVRRNIWYEPIDGSASQAVLVHMEENDWDYYDFKFNPVPGIHDSILTMRVGEEAIFYIPYQEAFGEQGSGDIPPRAQVIMKFEILEAFPSTEEEIIYEKAHNDEDDD
ncbi:FKBP-type peptidyl-prolyl cis-trans isomerase [Giardia duodenalis assemblage B]|uniref:peptidylprolyl isomerase n=1 Tax=Giardia duodenalis assemblage B TaxID=1394984 RepID=A0A132NPZ2_GIAIN|nr:FKBP-type peptidyl-prolyl cis-trans isomerase [Giardia intestinalis assemblage B]